MTPSHGFDGATLGAMRVRIRSRPQENDGRRGRAQKLLLFRGHVRDRRRIGERRNHQRERLGRTLFAVAQTANRGVVPRVDQKLEPAKSFEGDHPAVAQRVDRIVEGLMAGRHCVPRRVP